MRPSSFAAKVARKAVFIALIAGATQTHSAATDATGTVRALNTDLLAHASATEVLGRWCAIHHLADPPVIKALRDTDVDKPADRKVRRLLRVAPGDAIRYRRVRLACGEHILSNADNWYVPGRLTSDMNRQLDQTDTPFGLVVKPLDFHRVRLAVTFRPGRRGAEGVLRHEALLVAASGAPFSLVVETYTPDILIVSPPGR